MHTFPFLFARPCLKHQATSAQRLDAKHRVESYRRRFRTKSYKNSRGKDCCASPRRANGKGAINARTSLCHSPIAFHLRLNRRAPDGLHKSTFCKFAARHYVRAKTWWGDKRVGAGKRCQVNAQDKKPDPGNNDQQIPIVQRNFCRKL